MPLPLSDPNGAQRRRLAVMWQSGRRRKPEMPFAAAASGIQLPTIRSDAWREDIALPSRAERQQYEHAARTRSAASESEVILA